MRTVLIFALLLAAGLAGAQERTITFTAETTTAVEQVTPVLTWSTSPAADACSASGDWSGDKGPSGTETLAPITSGATYNLSCEWSDSSATLSWTPPTENTDGSPLTDLDHFNVYWGQSDGGPYPSTNPAPIDAGTTSYVVEGLAAGTWFFVATAVNANGIESVFSNQAQKTVEGTIGHVESVGITVNPRPAAPGGLVVQ